MGAFQVAKFNQSTTIAWSDGSLFNGYLRVKLVLPTDPVLTYTEAQITTQLGCWSVPLYSVIPIKSGKYDANSGLIYNSDVTPPNTCYLAYLFTKDGVQVAGPTATFLADSPTVVLSTLVPTIPTRGTS